ncbi:TMV resistance protein N [Morus notabilis]|uniref:ADP-ribosyl cyclase/cyclic ADP-ribose hydrolase n=1 Tax=Morus notabilis TaxID=981085 RepID=W9SUI0_9ROSA|nr:TMV resistance protein N [Morus notabilis]
MYFLFIHDSSEAIFVKNIVEEVLDRLCSVPSSKAADDFQGLVGINKRLEKMESLLSINSPTVRIIGIWGMGGIGKTTLAESLYKQFSSKYDSCFFTDVNQEVSKYGLNSLREKLLCKLLKRKCVDHMDNSFKDVQLRRKKVLVVLDNVHELEQLECLVGEHDAPSNIGERENCRFGVGSRIIATSRDKKLLMSKADEIYEVDALDSNEARSLFYLKAFKRDLPVRDFTDLVESVLDYAKGNPLALEVLGSYLHSRTRKEWKSALSELKKAPNERIQKVLRKSYDGLDRVKKSIFLDIACFFKGENRDFVEGILGSESHIGINVLIERSLITIKDCKLWMHDLIQEMGWEIGNEEPSKELAKRSRFWIPQDVIHVLENNCKGKSIEGIFLDLSKIDNDLWLEPTVFQAMYNLRLLKLYYHYDKSTTDKKCKVYFHQGHLHYLPNSLRYLNWWNYPSKTLPIKFRPESLVALEMPCSQLQQLWDGVQPLGNLKHIDLSDSMQLAGIPDLSHVSRLETVNLRGCESLVEIPPLKFQILDGPNSKQYGEDLYHTRAFGTLNLSGCTNLKTLPEITGNIRILMLSWTGIKELPSSIRSLENLVCLDLQGCENLEIFPELPRNIERLDFSCTTIREMATTSIDQCLRGVEVCHISCCKRLESIPSNPEILEPTENLDYLSVAESGIQELPLPYANIIGIPELSINRCRNIKTIPKCLCTLSCLTKVDLSYCNISEIPHCIGSLYSLTRLDLKENMFASIPSSIKQLPKLYHLDVSHCRYLRSLPELPSSIRDINAKGCLSMEKLLTSGPTLTQAYRVRYYDESVRFMFCDCLKLDQSARDIMAMDFLCRVICNAMISRVVKDVSEFGAAKIEICYPGNRIPKWIWHQSEGSSSLSIKLPPNWDTSKFFGFVVCVVLSFEELHWRNVCACCELHLRTKQGKSHHWTTFSMILDNIYFDPVLEEANEIKQEFLRSDHVFMWYDYYKRFLKGYDEDFEVAEMSFDFFCQEITPVTESSFKYEVKRCGIHMLCVEKEPMMKVFNNTSIEQCKKYMLEAKELGINTLQHVQSLQGSGDIAAVERGFQLKGMEVRSEDLLTLYDFFRMEAASYDIGSHAFDPWMSDDRIDFSSQDSNIALTLSTDPKSFPPEADALDQVNNPSCLEIVPIFYDFLGMEIQLHDERNSAGPSLDSTKTHEEAICLSIPFSIGFTGDQTNHIIFKNDSDAKMNDGEPSTTQVINFDIEESCFEKVTCFDFWCCSSFLSKLLGFTRPVVLNRLTCAVDRIALGIPVDPCGRPNWTPPVDRWCCTALSPINRCTLVLAKDSD